MKSKITLFIASLLILFACEGNQDDDPGRKLLIDNISETIILGSSSDRILADFHYVDGSKLIDHITWSNHQTHYFEYDAQDRISVVRMKKIDVKRQEEMWYEYDENGPVRIKLVLKNLDYVYLEPVDSSYTGYVEYGYSGNRIDTETRYEFPVPAGSAVMTSKCSFIYDDRGNILRRERTEYIDGTAISEVVDMTYDEGLHPFSGLSYYFTGESTVNNMLSRSSSVDGSNYSYEIQTNDYGYPEVIFEQLGSTNTRIIRYTYLTP